MLRRLALVLGVAASAPALHAQAAGGARIGASRDTAVADTAPIDSAARRRALRRGPPISPRRALLESMAIPGWGQASLHRATAGGLFAALEATSIAMLIQSAKELHIAQDAARDSVLAPGGGSYVQNPLAARIGPRKQAVEDWTALLIFTHLIAGADAFVAAHLWDVPIEVQGHGGARSASISARVPF